MGSPFGLAYGLGAGLAAGPIQAYYKGQDDAMARGLKELELAKARREAADTAAENAALSQPVAGPAATSVMSPGVTQEELDSHKVGPDEYGPNMPDDLQQISKPVQVTPFQSDAGLEAARLKQAAETLRSQGRGLSAMVYDKQAKELGKEHQKASVLALIQASKYGDNERMLGALHAIGATSARGARVSPGGITVTAGDGSELELDQHDLQAMFDGKDPVDVWKEKAKTTYENNVKRDTAKAEATRLENERKHGYRLAEIEQASRGREHLAEVRQRYGAQAPAKIREMNGLAEVIMQTESISAGEALKRAKDEVYRADRGDVTRRDQYNAADRDVKAFIKDNPSASRPGDRDYPAYIELLRRRDAFVGGRGDQMTPPATPQGGGRFHVETDNSGKVIVSNDPNQRVGEYAKDKSGNLVRGKKVDYN